MNKLYYNYINNKPHGSSDRLEGITELNPPFFLPSGTTQGILALLVLIGGRNLL
jgi:hypothetical protein